MEAIKFGGKIIAEIDLQFDYPATQGRERVINSLVKDIKNSAIGYAGFRTKTGLRDYLASSIFDDETKIIPTASFNRREIIKIIRSTLLSCCRVLPTDKITVFVFPTFSTFVAKKMSGATGYTPWKGVILLFINPRSTNWKRALPKTIAHEFNHAVVLKYQKWTTLLDSMIFEGLAEHFKEAIFGGGRSPWTKALPLPESRVAFARLRKNITSASPKLYYKVFFENKTYPRWTGYTIGYHIVEQFIKSEPSVPWEKLVKYPPTKILWKSGF